MEVLATPCQFSRINELESNEEIKLAPSYDACDVEDFKQKGSIHGKEVVEEANMTAEERLDRGYMKFGCPHYRRRCRIRAPCCNEIFDCQCCHNEAKNAISLDLKQRHEVPRHQVQKVVCSLCGIEQDVHQVCINCGVCMGKYLCETCKLFDDDVSKKQYHCSGCGICRIGGHENFCHCFKCGQLMYTSHDRGRQGRGRGTYNRGRGTGFLPSISRQATAILGSESQYVDLDTFLKNNEKEAIKISKSKANEAYGSKSNTKTAKETFETPELPYVASKTEEIIFCISNNNLQWKANPWHIL